MKCVFTTNSQSFSTFPLLKTAINSLLKNTKLQPVVIWGDHCCDTTEMVSWLTNRNIEIIVHPLSFAKEIEHFSFEKIDCKNKILERMYKSYPDYYNWRFIVTESLRIDIPLLFPDEKFVLYSDCDVLFLRDIPEITFEEPLAAAVRINMIQQTKFFNNGIMILNIPKMKECYEEFKNFYIKSNYSFDIGNTTTQGAYNTFFKDKVFELPIEFNWHWFNGIKGIDFAWIIHFCGPKPTEWKDMLLNKLKYDDMYMSCMRGIDYMRYYLNTWNKFAEDSDKIFL